MYPAPHPAFPTVESYGGSVLATPHFVSVTFSNDTATMIQTADNFVGAVGGTSYWTQTTAEYGVGTATVGAPIHLAETAPTTIDDAQVQQWLVGKLSGPSPAFGTPNPNAIYVLFYPAGSTITYSGYTSCQEFGGYHGSVTVGAREYAYAVIPRCNSGMGLAYDLTSTTSHELIEAATDPFLNNPAYGTVDLDHIAWEMVLLGEVSDLCAQDSNAVYQPAGFSWYVQRSWSNAAPLMGKDSCQPSLPGEVYFNAVPVMTDTITFNWGGQPGSTKGVHIPLGTSRTIEVDLFSEGPASAWTVSASAYQQGSLSFAWNRTSGVNGDKLQLTITANSYVQEFGASPFVVVSRRGNEQHWYWGLVH